MFEGNKLPPRKWWLAEIEWPSIVGAILVLAFALLVVVPAYKWSIATPYQEQPAAAAQNNRPNKELQRETFWVRSLTDPVAFFTLVLAVSTIGLWTVTWRTLHHARADSKRQDMRMRETLALARDEFEATHRPWMVPHVAVGPEGLVFTQQGGISLQLVLAYRNIGTSPGLNVAFSCDVDFVRRDDPFIKLAALCGSFAAGHKGLLGATAFPTSDTSPPLIWKQGVGHLEGRLGGNRCAPIIVGVLAYQFPFGKDQWHFSRFVYRLRGAEGQNVFKIPEGDFNILGSSLQLSPWHDGQAFMAD